MLVGSGVAVGLGVLVAVGNVTLPLVGVGGTGVFVGVCQLCNTRRIFFPVFGPQLAVIS